MTAPVSAPPGRAESVAEPKNAESTDAESAEIRPLAPRGGAEPSAPEAAPAGPAADANTLILNDPLVKRTVELFQARVMHVEPWKKQ